MKLSGGRIFVITAGMMSENTAAHDLAARMIGDERQAIFFVGYADPDTPGGRLKAAKPGETFIFSGSAGRSDPALRNGGFRPHRARQPRRTAQFCRPGFAAHRPARPRRAKIRANGSRSKSAPAIPKSKSSSPSRGRLWKCDIELRNDGELPRFQLREPAASDFP